jgi:uncharacterized glyoxalase superfamily protein PhnB
MSGQVFFPTLYYNDVRAALDWLERAFGFEIAMVVTSANGELGHCEMSHEGHRVYIGKAWTPFTAAPSAADGIVTASIDCMVEDADAHCERARAAGARIFQEPRNEFYGARAYHALDLEGQLWRFSQPLKTMSFEEMERASGGRKVRASL